MMLSRIYSDYKFSVVTITTTHTPTSSLTHTESPTTVSLKNGVSITVRMRAMLAYMYVLSQFKLSLVFCCIKPSRKKAQIVNVS